jgi:exodeoxyribonuclease-1
VEQQIFNGFYGWNDKARLKEFQGADWLRRQEIVATFDDARLRQLGARLVAFHSSSLLSESDRRRYLGWRRERWNVPIDVEVDWMTLEKARQAILEMREATVNDPSMLELSEAFLSMLEANSLGSKPN